MIRAHKGDQEGCVFITEGSTLANKRNYITVTKHTAVEVHTDLIPSQHFLCFL
jgi:hypothetical protein